MKIVVDTNVLLNAILPASGQYWLFEGILNGQFTLCVTTQILAEYAEIFARFYTPEIADTFLTALLYSPFVARVDAYFHWRAIPIDPDDDKFVDCSVAANAHCIVTNDRHFNVLKELAFPRIQVLSAAEFRALINASCVVFKSACRE